MLKKILTQYLSLEALSGLALFIAAALAVFLVNSHYRHFYEAFVNQPIGISIGELHYQKTLIFWVNDGFISFFFLLIGMEIKREILNGHLSQPGQLTLPFSAALAGMIVPAIIYAFFNLNNDINMRGWAIPTAMDTAFALGVLSLFGTNIPTSLRMFLMSLSIIDDILAVIIIAIFYAEELSHLSILASLSILCILMLLNLLKINKALPYLILGFLLWFFFLKSGVHTAIAGVLLAFCIPMQHKDKNKKGLLLRMEKKLHPWVSFVILPIFAFTNSGILFSAFSVDKLSNPLALGIILGLFVGKQVGVFSIVWLFVRNKIASLPLGVTWLQMYVASLLCGIGFTMSLFIGALSFESGGPEYNELVKSAIYVGSILSAICAILVFSISLLIKWIKK